MVGKCIPYWTSPFLGDMLVFWGVVFRLYLFWSYQIANEVTSTKSTFQGVLPPWPAPPKKMAIDQSASHKKSNCIPRLFVHILQAKFQMSVNLDGNLQQERFSPGRCLWQIWGITFCASNQWRYTRHVDSSSHMFLDIQNASQTDWRKHWLCNIIWDLQISSSHPSLEPLLPLVRRSSQAAKFQVGLLGSLHANGASSKAP